MFIAVVKISIQNVPEVIPTAEEKKLLASVLSVLKSIMLKLS
jgi:hypothetical protein